MIRRAYGSWLVGRALRGQTKVPFLPREELDRRRDKRRRAALAYATKHVPYYQGLKDLPVLDRDEVRAHPERFTAPNAKGLRLTTSGTTATPITLLHDRRSLLENIAYGERERAAVNALAGGFRPSELYVGYATSNMHDISEYYVRETLMPRPRRTFVDIDTPLDEVAELARQTQPDLIVGYGGWIDLFFKTAGADVTPKVVMSMGEALPHGGREHIEDTLGIPVMQRYNAVESLKIGFFCEHRTGFHLHEDLVDVRADDDGRLILSNYVNRGTVLLNYPIGDVGRISDEPCPCGRTFRRLVELEGRVEDIIHLADGRFVHPRQVWEVLKAEPALIQYQLVQTAPEAFTLEVAGEVRDVARLRELLGGARVEVRPRPKEPRRGKFRAVVALPR